MIALANLGMSKILYVYLYEYKHPDTPLAILIPTLHLLQSRSSLI